MKQLLTLITLAITLQACNGQENPKYIGKEYGTFDLGKMTFNENIADLTSKTKVWKTAIVNQNNEEKDIEELTKSDTVKLYKYHFSNQQNQILGKKPFSYNNRFFFNGLTLLANANNKIIAYNATVFYDGEMPDILAFTDYLKTDNQTFTFKQNKLIGAQTICQWFADHKIVQFVRDDSEGTEEHTYDGKTTTIKSTYVKLNVYTPSFIENQVEKDVTKDPEFVIFNEKHYYNK